VSETCRILQLSRASFYRRQEALRLVVPEALPVVEPQNAALIATIHQLAGKHPLWGYRRITAFLQRREGLHVNRKRVRRLMRAEGLSVPVKRYKAKRTETRAKPKATHRNQWWGTDMTKFYVEGLGWLYLVVVIDWYTKRILAHSLKLRSTGQEWLDVLQDAVAVACPLGSRVYGIRLMSDNGSQPTCTMYEKAVVALGIEHVTTSYNNPKGNADTERFMRTFKEEVVWPNEFSSFEDALVAVEEFFRFYNEEYPHSTLGGMSPIEFEASLKTEYTELQTVETAAA
jgi:putative transposase